MIPILYDRTGNTKITNLTDCIQCIVTEERNGIFEAELVYLVHSDYSDKLIRGNIIVADANDTLKEQKFRIYKVSKPINGRIKVLARHISFDMARDVIIDLTINNRSCEYALNKLFSSSQFSQHFKGHSDIVDPQSTVISGTNNILKAIVGAEGSIIDTFGSSPEILRDNYDFYIYENRGHDNGVIIEYGKNLTGLNLDTDGSNMITRIRAVAKYRNENYEEILVVSSPEFIDSPYINNYETPFIQEIDFSDKFKNDDIPTPLRLKTLAEEYFVNNKCDLPSENATISFIPLSKCAGYEGIQDKISLCDIVTVIDYRYNLAAKVKVIKVSYNVLKERYENMEVGEPRSRLGDIISNSINGIKGEKGDKGDKGEPGAPGNIGDFPDSLPATPTLTSFLYGFANIELSWTFESQPYYTYELYASRIEDFTPNEFDLLFEGKASTFLFQAKPNETWYFRVRCVNSHGRATDFSSQVTVTTTKIDDLSNYVENAAIGEALIGTLSLDRGWVGTLKGNYIDAKQLSVTDGNGKRTLFIDSFGNVSLDVTELKISSKKPATAEDIEDLENKFNEDIEKITVTERNLVKNSAFLYGESGWNFHTNVTLDTSKTFNGHPSAKIAQSGLPNNFYRGAINYNLSQTTFEKDEVYTMSCYYYVEDKSTIDSDLVLEVKGTKLGEAQEQINAIVSYLLAPSDIIEGSWTRIYKTFTIPYTYEKCCIRGHLVRNGTAWFTDFKLEKNNKASQWTPAFEDNETYVDNLIVDLQTQLDGKIQTYSQSTDPSTNWTATEKANHEGDIWYNASTKNTYRWNGNSWILLQNAEAQSAKEIAQTKAQVFIAQPTIPYYKGDLWITSTEKGKGIVKTCITTRIEGSYTASDWVENLKYTDDTFATQLQEELNNLSVGGRNYILNGKGDVKAGFFKNFSKVENGYGEHTLTSQKTYASVIIDSGFVLDCRDYDVGKQVTWSYDFMYTNWNFPSGSNRAELWIGQRYAGSSSTSSVGAYRGVTQHNLPVVGENGCELNKWIHIEKTITIPEQAGEGIGTSDIILFYNSNVDISASITFRIKNVKLEYGNKATDWTPAPEDTDTYIDNLVTDLQGQLDGKIETYSQADDPSVNWTTIEKPRHEGDIWYNTSTKNTYRWNGTAWVLLQNAEAQSAKELAQTKAQVFTRTPVIPYYVGDLWVTALDGTGVVKTCITTRTSGSFVGNDWVENLKYTDDTFAEQVQKELNNLSIGGRNYIKNSNNVYMKPIGATNYDLGFDICDSFWENKNRFGMITLSFDVKPDSELAEDFSSPVWFRAEPWHAFGQWTYPKGSTEKRHYVLQVNLKNMATSYKPSQIFVRFQTKDTIGMTFTNVKMEIGTKATDWTPAPEDTDTYIDNLAYDLQNQIDGKIETYSQADDPGANWTTIEKPRHKGDIWYNTSSKLTYRWNGTAWEKLSNQEAIDASNLASTKAQVFIRQPITPYYKGDLWVTALDGTGVVKTCVTTRTNGDYTASDWVESLKYTDDTFANQLQTKFNELAVGGINLLRNGSFEDGLNYWTIHDASLGGSIKSVTTPSGETDWIPAGKRVLQIRGTSIPGRYGVQSTEMILIPNTKYTISGYCAGHRVNALQINVRDLDKSSGNIHTINVAPVSGGSTLNKWYRVETTFTTTSSTRYALNLYAVDLGDDGHAWFEDFQVQQGTKATAWSPCPEDTDTYIDNLVADLQGQLDGKVQTYAQNTDPSTSWNTTELKNQHTGDIWYDTNNKTTYRWNGSSWVKLSNKEAEEASNLANSKAQVFTAQPTVPYKKGDLWVTALDGTGIVKTCIKDRTSGSYTASEWVENLKYTDDTLAERVQDELDNLSIGGRNLVKNSAFLYGTNSWNLHANVTLDNTKLFNGHPSCKSSQSGLEGNNWRGCKNYYLPLGPADFKKGETYTLSCYYYVEDKTSIDIGITLELKGTPLNSTESVIGNLGISPSNIIENNWTRISKTITLTQDYSVCCIYAFVDRNGTVWFTDFKLEKGNRVSDWSPAPEDTNYVINDAIKDLPTIDDVGDAKDSAIIASKIETIKQSYNILKSEYNKNIQQSEIIYKNSYLEGTAKTNLNTAITNYKTAFTAVTSARDSIVNANTITTSQANAWNTAITNIQTSTDTLAKRVQEAQTYIDTAIYNASVDYTNQAIPDALTGYAKESYVDDAMERAVDDARDGMVSSTDLTLNNEEILLSAASMGQYNLLRNSDFRNEFDSWNSWGMTSPHYRVITTSDSNAMNGENNACIYSNSSNVGNISLGIYQDVALKTGSTYTVSYWVNSVNSTMRVQIESYNSNNEQTTLANKSYININGNKDRNTWKFDSITFTVPSNSNRTRVVFAVTRSENAIYKAFLVKPMLVSGNKAQAWTGHPDEIYVGVVSITEKKGLMVEHSNANTKTVMSANGFSIEDSNGDVLAWLSSKEQWTELKANKVFADNIENVYTGDSYLYVDHSKTVAGNGTSSNPFNSFAQLSAYLQATPVINYDLYITVKNPGFNINEMLKLNNLKGLGFIKITLEGQLTILNQGGSNCCMEFHQIDKFLWIVGSRELGSSTTGAVLRDGGDGNGYGIWATDVRRIEVDAITIACKNTGLLAERCHAYTWHCDFGKCDIAVELRYQSLYYSNDDVGSCSKFCVLRSGSFAYWGAGTTRPQGSVDKSNGVYYDGGTSLTATASPRYSSANPTPPSTSGQTFTYTYNCTSKQSYQYSWSNWSTDGSCKQGAWGYGLRGGHMFFNISSIRNQVTGTIQDGNTITLTRANSGGISGDANVYINGSTCSGASGTPSYSNNTHLGTLRWGETKTFTLPKAIVQSLINGTCSSLAVYVNSTASNNYINITNASITLKTKK